jgi:hypothetical protein
MLQFIWSQIRRENKWCVQKDLEDECLSACEGTLFVLPAEIEKNYQDLRQQR